MDSTNIAQLLEATFSLGSRWLRLVKKKCARLVPFQFFWNRTISYLCLVEGMETSLSHLCVWLMFLFCVWFGTWDGEGDLFLE
jgi:hypothetical protein